MSQIESIREQWSEGKSISEIARAVSVDRNTVYKYVNIEDFNKSAACYAPRGCKMDAYRDEIAAMLKEERKWFHKQRYTSRRMLEILRKEHEGLDCSYATAARYIASMKREIRRESYSGPGTMTLVWHEGEAQADFGEADFILGGKQERLKYFNLTFPFSNMVFTAISEGETCECVCSCLQQIFRHMGHVPSRIVFDNATGIGRRAFGTMKETELFTRFRLHYGFKSTFTNPRAGYEKGCVENSIGAVRRNLFVPPISAYRPFSLFNERVMLPMSENYRSEDSHYRKDVKVGELFQKEMEEMQAMNPLEFNVERFESIQLSETGTAKLDSGKHEYVLGPSFAGSRMVAGRTAESVNFYSVDGALQKSFDRVYGSAPTVAYDLESILKGLANKPNGWMNSPVREAIEDNEFRRYIDNSDQKARRSILYMLSKNAEEFGFGISCVAMEDLFHKGKVPTKEDLSALSRRLRSFPSEGSCNPTGVDLKVFDALMCRKEA